MYNELDSDLNLLFAQGAGAEDIAVLFAQYESKNKSAALITTFADVQRFAEKKAAHNEDDSRHRKLLL